MTLVMTEADYTPARPLLSHQARELERMSGHEAWALLMEFGTGKSCVVVTDAGRLFTQGECTGVLVLAPKGVFSDWSTKRPETSHWLLNLDPRVADRALVHLWQGGHSKWEQQKLAMLHKWQGLAVLVVNIEALSMSQRALGVCDEFLRSRLGSMLVVDESTTVKAPSSKRTKRVVKLAGLARWRRILTGFPTPHSSLDLYTQFMVLDWRILGHRSYFTFRNRYAVVQPLYLGSRTVQQIVGYQNTEELWRRMAPYSSRVRADDCLDLPPSQYRRREVDLPDETRRVYREMVESGTSELLSGQHVSATLAITLIMRLHQLCCGTITTELGEVVELPSAKYDELLELVEEIGSTEKVVVWAHFRHSIVRTIEVLRKAYGHESVVEYWGDTSDAQREEAKRRFASDDTCRFFVGSQMAGGRGLNDLVVARHAVFMSNPADLELRLNAEARTRRHGSELHSLIVYHDLITRESMEEKLVKALRSKLDLASLVLGEAWREWLE
jgi:SNF2 family DNA or RNA helicase